MNLSERRKNNPRKLPIPWDEIESLYCAGYSAKAIADEYEEVGVKVSNIRKRSSKHSWPTPYNLRKRAAEMIKEAQSTELNGRDVDTPTETLAKRVATQQLTHQNTVLDITSKALQDLQDSSKTIIRSAHDFELVDRVARRTMALDKEDETSGLAININGFAHQPVIVEQVDV